MPAMLLQKLLPDVELKTHLSNLPVTGMCLDSRKVQPGDLFFAVPGSELDGREFIKDAISRGATLILEEQEGSSVEIKEQGSVLTVSMPDLSRKVSEVASRFYSEPSARMPVVGVTGTNGKTSCSVLLAQLSHRLGKRSGVIGTLGYGLLDSAANTQSLNSTGLTTPDAIHTQEIFHSLYNQGAELVIMEVSSHSLDQARVAAIDFDIAIFTNLTRDHLDYHGDMAAYGRAKQQLFEMACLKCAIINLDDEFGRELFRVVSKLPLDCLSYSLSDQGADIHVSQLELSDHGVRANLHSPWGEGVIDSQLLGPYNLSNMLAVIAAACSQGYSLDAVLSKVPDLVAVPGRMQNIDTEADIQVVVDYAHTPDALEKTLEALRPHTHGKLWSVFGCGGDRDAGKRPLMASISERLADRVVVTSDNPRNESPEDIVADIVAGLQEQSRSSVILDRAQAIAQSIADASPGDTVLIAGKGHEDYQLVGDQVLQFSDFAEARKALAQRRADGGENA